MRIYSKPTYLETAPSDTSITILGTISGPKNGLFFSPSFF